MKKTKKYLVVVKHYTIKKREPDLELIALCDTETEASKKCKRKYSDIIEVWAENWPQDIRRIKLVNPRPSNWVEDWMKENKK